MTYTDVHLVLGGRRAARALQPLWRDSNDARAALVLNRKRVRRGPSIFDLPEPLIEFDEWGAMTGVTRAPRNIAHRIIEEFMLRPNEAWLVRGPSRSPHPRKARPQAVMEFEEIGHALRLLAGDRRGSG